MADSYWYEDFPVLADLPADRAAAALREIGEIDLALALENVKSDRGERPPTFGLLDRLSIKPRPWMHAAHAFGFLPQHPAPGKEHVILAAGEIDPDETLINSRIKIVLNRLAIADYPGGSKHTVLFDFFARNQVAGGVEDVHYNATFSVEDGSAAGVVGYPIFLGLGVGQDGVSFKGFTVNVKNQSDEQFLGVLDSAAFRTGLKLTAVAQPALIPLSQMALGLTKWIASRSRNVVVQNFQMGLDFAGTRMGARLAQGDYFAVQIPSEIRRAWRWDDWEHDPSSGEIVSATDGSHLPFNHIVFGVTRYEGASS